jgi:hypothetical protein
MSSGSSRRTEVFAADTPCGCGTSYLVYTYGKRCVRCGRIRTGVKPGSTRYENQTVQQLMDILDESFSREDLPSFPEIVPIHYHLADKIARAGGLCLLEEKAQYSREYWRLITFHTVKRFEILPVKGDRFDRDGYIQYYRGMGLDTDLMLSRLEVFDLSGPFPEGRNVR